MQTKTYRCTKKSDTAEAEKREEATNAVPAWTSVLSRPHLGKRWLVTLLNCFDVLSNQTPTALHQLCWLLGLLFI